MHTRIDDALRVAAVVRVLGGIADLVPDWGAEMAELVRAADALTLPVDPLYLDCEHADGRPVSVPGYAGGGLIGCLTWTRGDSLFLVPFAQPGDPWQDVTRPHHVVHFHRGEAPVELGDIYVGLPAGPIDLPHAKSAQDIRVDATRLTWQAARRALRLLAWLADVGVTRTPTTGPASAWFPNL